MALSIQVPAGAEYTTTLANEDSIPMVDATADITGPKFTGQLIFNRADNMVYRWDGTTWLAVLATGGATAATMHEAKYAATAIQNFATGADALVEFPTAVYASSDVTAGGTNNNQFTLNRAGWWLITASMRWVSSGAGTVRRLNIQTGNAVPSVATRLTSNTGGLNAACCACSVVDRFALSTVIAVSAFQDSGAGLNNDNGFGNSNHISLTWLRPL